MSSVLRVLISKAELDNMRSELERLREFHRVHQSASKSNLTKEGSGCSNDPSKTNHVECNSDRITSCHGQTNFDENLTTIINQAPPRVELQEKLSEQHLPIDVIISKLWKRHQSRAISLLKELEQIKAFKWDQFGVVKINDHLIGSIFDLMKITFQQNGKKMPNLNLYIELLKSCNLEKYVANRALFLKENEDKQFVSRYWYFIGN